MKAHLKTTLIKAALYGIMIAFTAQIGVAIPFPYHRAIGDLPVSVQTILFFTAGVFLFFLFVVFQLLFCLFILYTF